MPALVGGIAVAGCIAIIVVLGMELVEIWREFLGETGRDTRAEQTPDEPRRSASDFTPKKPTPLSPPPEERRSRDTIRRMIDFFEEEPE